jgi:hypothetical protein
MTYELRTQPSPALAHTPLQYHSHLHFREPMSAHRTTLLTSRHDRRLALQPRGVDVNVAVYRSVEFVCGHVVDG